jgi:hypothetical protein
MRKPNDKKIPHDERGKHSRAHTLYMACVKLAKCAGKLRVHDVRRDNSHVISTRTLASNASQVIPDTKWSTERWRILLFTAYTTTHKHHNTHTHTHVQAPTRKRRLNVRRAGTRACRAWHTNRCTPPNALTVAAASTCAYYSIASAPLLHALTRARVIAHWTSCTNRCHDGARVLYFSEM